MDYYAKSLELHEKHHGKLAVVSKVPVSTRDDLSIAYTPGVAEPCRQIAKNPADIYKYTNKGNAVAVVTDGSSILGLGNIGSAAGLPVMEGKAILFKEFGGVDAYPICLDTQDTDEIVQTVKRIAPGFGGINLEDITAPRCFEVEERLIDALNIPVFHDDQHGTAIVTLAALINAFKITGRKFEEAKVAISGAGSAGVAITKLLIAYGLKSENVILCDSRGAIYKGRANLNSVKEKLSLITNSGEQKGELKDILIGSDVLIGVSKPNRANAEMIRGMAKDPIVFALANPEPEISMEEAAKGGARIVATGRSDCPNQINNVLAFPGIFRGALDARIRKITDDIKIAAAEAIAACVSNPTPEVFMPNPLDRSVAQKVAEAVKKMAV